MTEVITMKDESNMSVRRYSKDIRNGVLVLDWILLSVELTPVCILSATAIGTILHVLDNTDFGITWYLVNDSPLVNPGLYSLAAFALSLFEVWRRYRLIDKESFALVNGETLKLRFGKDSFLWENIQKVNLEGDRKLIITFLDKGEIKRRLVDLKWLSEKENFIDTLKNYCTEKNIPYHQSEIRFTSQIELFLDSLYRYPHI
jgi:hypothetical protein